MTSTSGASIPSPAERQQLGDQAASYLRELIISGQLRPGEFIRLDRLAGELAMSVTPVRLALVTLRGEGFVRQEPNRGFVVSDLRSEDILDMFTVQAFVAGEMAAHAARNIDTAGIARLTKIVAAIEAAAQVKNLTEAEALAHEFHEVVIEAAGRPKLAWLLEMSGRYEPRRFYSEIEGWKRLPVREHKTILKSLRAHDPAGAREAMRSHVEHLGQLVASNFLETSQSALRPVTLAGQTGFQARHYAQTTPKPGKQAVSDTTPILPAE